MKKTISLLLALVMVLALAACGGGSDSASGGSSGGSASGKTDVKALLEPFFGDWVNMYEYDDTEVKNASLGDGTLTLEGEEYTFSWDNAQAIEGDDGLTDAILYTDPQDDGSCYCAYVFLYDFYGPSFYALDVSEARYDSQNKEFVDADTDFYESFISLNEFTEVTLTDDNWMDYLSLKRAIIPETDDFGDVCNMTLDYVLDPADPDTFVIKADVTIGFNCSDLVETEVTYDSATGKYEIGEDIRYVYSDSAGYETAKLDSYDLREDRFSGFLYTWGDEFVNEDGICSVIAELPLYVEITRIEGTVYFLGEPDTSLGGVNEEWAQWKAEAEAAGTLSGDGQPLDDEEPPEEAQPADESAGGDDDLYDEALYAASTHTDASGEERATGLSLIPGRDICYRYTYDGILTGVDYFILSPDEGWSLDELEAMGLTALDVNFDREDVAAYDGYGTKSMYHVYLDHQDALCVHYAFNVADDPDMLNIIRENTPYGSYIRDNGYVGEAIYELLNSGEYSVVSPMDLMNIYMSDY